MTRGWRGGALPPLALARVELAHVDVSPKTTWSFVRLVADDGTQGVGEASLPRTPQALDSPFGKARSAIGGSLPELLAFIDRAPRANLADAAVASALEHALWDLVGRHAGRPVRGMLGNQARAVPLYANINRRTIDRSPAGFVASARAAIASGYSKLKVAPFDGLEPANAESPAGIACLELGIERVAALRDAAGPNVDIYVDCHWRMTPAVARKAIDALAGSRVSWFECPIGETLDTIAELRALRGLANARGMVLAGLEELTGVEAFQPYLEAGAYDVVMPDVKYVGGIAALERTASLAARHGARCAPHNPTGPVCHAASLAVCAADVRVAQLEVQYDETPHFFGIAGPALPRPSGGASAAPSAPGLGVALDVRGLPVRTV